MPAQKSFNIAITTKKLVSGFILSLFIVNILIFFLDIWSLGCVLYYMIVLELPFNTPNILLLAGKVCKGDYDRTPLRQHSKQLQETVIECLIVDPILRPDISDIARLCTEELMCYMDRSCSTIQSLESAYSNEK